MFFLEIPTAITNLMVSPLVYAWYNSVFHLLLCLFCSAIVEVISMVKSEDMRYWNVPVPKSLDDAKWKHHPHSPIFR
jgi:hypothetical protein